MRNLVSFEAQSRQAFGRFTVLVRLWRNVQTRKDLRLLQSMDDHVLRDIGLTRDEVRRLLSLSNRVDLMWEVERLKLLRGR
jgi:uncharacterized protein YjiS (DUF1127 family)